MNVTDRNPAQWVTLAGCRKVLVVVHTEVYGRRLLDVLPLLASDLRVQVAFTVAPHAFNGGTRRALHGVGEVVLPWEEAVRTEFDLALAAGSQGTERLRAPLVRLPHGAGHIKLSRVADARAAGEPRAVGGMGRSYLMWGDRVVPAAYAVAHDEDLALLRVSCPEAVPITEVVGDGVHDRIAASMPLRERYRLALGLRQGERLVLVSSTWGLGSSFNRLDALLPRLLTELPGRGYRIAVLVHPNVWSGHGDWQVRSWLAALRRRGVVLVSPGTDWRPLLVAADWVLGDHGSVTLYATMTRAAILLARFPEEDVNPDSPGAELARTAPALSVAHPLAEQLAYAAEAYPTEAYARIAARISSEPGRFDANMRRLLYRILRLGEPAYQPVTAPLPDPRPLETEGAAHGRPEDWSEVSA
ncbi:hypothetical protein [Streptomyces sp. NPDC051909]|uniref:hypothetical protein n=1 Tax=Streptomyces sp. NPDC051909 TaxID=3154944 RepID=UPI00343B9031